MNYINKYLVEEDKWSTRYKVGFPMETLGTNKYEGYSIHEFLVTIDLNNNANIMLEEI